MRTRTILVVALSALIALSGCATSAQSSTAPSEAVTPEATHELRPTDATTAAPDDSNSSDQPTQAAGSDASATPQKPDQPLTGVLTGQAIIESMDILTLESMPVQINVVLKGNLPDGCTHIGDIGQSFDADSKTFTLTVPTTRPLGVMCTMALVPFSQTVSLKVAGLTKGTYTVNANGQTGTFELIMDNAAPTP